jgi:hypothetical protein
VVAALVAGAWAWTTLSPKNADTPRPPSTAPSAKTSAPPAETPLVVESPPVPKLALGKPANQGSPMSTGQSVAAAQVFYTTAKVRMRSRPSTNSTVVRTVAAGQPVHSIARQGEWHNVTVGAAIGWIRGDFLIMSSTPAAPRPKVDVAPRAPLVTDEPKPSRKAEVAKQDQRSDGDPIREAYVGTCDCPYDVKRNGARCGGTSAWSRPGGRSPTCFVGE